MMSQASLSKLQIRISLIIISRPSKDSIRHNLRARGRILSGKLSILRNIITVVLKTISIALSPSRGANNHQLYLRHHNPPRILPLKVQPLSFTGV